MDGKDYIAIYGAGIGTLAFFLNVLNWWLSRPRLHLTLIRDGQVIGGGPEQDETDLMVLTVVNRGKSSTTLQNLLLWKMPSKWARLRMRPEKTFVVTNPQLKGRPLNLPQKLDPATSWTGILRKREDLIPDLEGGQYYAVVEALHRKRPYLIKVRKKA